MSVVVPKNVSFGMLVAPALVPGGHQAIQGHFQHKKGDVAIQAWISVDFGRISGPHFKIVGELWNKICVSCHVCSQDTF